MKLNKVYEGKIIDDNLNGNGVLKINDFPVFVPFTVKGDIVKIKIVKLKKKYAIGKVITYIKKENQNQICPYYLKCGGCNLLNITYERENWLKENYIKKLFQDVPISYNNFNRFNYRNKVSLHVKNGKIGFYEEKTNALIQIENCLLLKEEINKFISKLKNLDLSSIKEIVIKAGDNNDLLVSVTGNITKEDISFLKGYKNLKSLYINNILIYGKKYINITIGKIKYSLNHNSFFQINNECTKVLYTKIKENVKENSKMLDLYCGSGSIGIFTSDICTSITGVEINKESVSCALENFKLNNIKNYKILNDDASIIKEKFDIVVVDPPRSGLSKEVIKNLNDMKTEKLIYISCNPSTLKRDITLLNSYKLKSIDIFNMFPATKHTECLCIMNLK